MATNLGNNAPQASTSAPKSQKQMSKAERREIQERQRAAKADKTGKQQAKPKDRETPAAAPSAASTSTLGSIARRPALPPSFVQQLPPHTTRLATSTFPIPQRPGLLSARTNIFSHLSTLQIPQLAAQKERGNIHPEIVRLALKYVRFKICGANARCIAMLLAFKSVISDYSTPSGTTLSRHLNTHLTHQITHLIAHGRPLGVSMGNAIRHFKELIGKSSIDLAEADAKKAILESIDTYIEEKFLAAAMVIRKHAIEKIKDGDVIMTFARSSTVETVLLHAWNSGRRFSVIVVDSRPLLEGKRLLNVLTRHSIPATYALLPALPVAPPSLILLGAHSVHSNGAVLSRAGTALVAMSGKGKAPVLVCAETCKVSEGVLLDGFGRNELAPLSLLSADKEKETVDEEKNDLQIVNPLYDLTPPDMISAVVTEVGIVPPSGISTVATGLRGGNGGTQT